jgi:hypothetical protein
MENTTRVSRYRIGMVIRYHLANHKTCMHLPETRRQYVVQRCMITPHTTPQFKCLHYPPLWAIQGHLENRFRMNYYLILLRLLPRSAYNLAIASRRVNYVLQFDIT